MLVYDTAQTMYIVQILYQLILKNDRKSWLAMPLGAGLLHWVLACRTIDEKNDRLSLASLCLLH